MLEANKGKRRQKMRGEILQTATEHIENYYGYYKGQRIYNTLVDVWTTAFRRGYDKALRGQVKEKP
jgi:fatty acid/phospholipid biosynthesis enzyme